MSGLILAVFIGGLVAWVFGRARRKMKLPMTAKHYGWAILVVFVLLVIIYGASGHVSPR